MEFKAYLLILLRRLWVVAPTFLITLAATLFFTFTQTPLYRTVATFVMMPDSSFQDAKSFLSGLDVMSNRTPIASTYANECRPSGGNPSISPSSAH